MRNQLKHSHASWLSTSCFAAGAAVVCLIVLLRPAESQPQTSSEQLVYDRDAQHLWNRLYEALLIRVGPDGRTYGRDRFEPLLWLGSKHLLEGPSHDRAVKLLNEFREMRGEKLIEDPLKRAVFQRDLWLVFCWLQGDDLDSLL